MSLLGFEPNAQIIPTATSHIRKPLQYLFTKLQVEESKEVYYLGCLFFFSAHKVQIE